MRTFRLLIVGIGLVVLAATQASGQAFENLARINATEAVWSGEPTAERVRSEHVPAVPEVRHVSVSSADPSSFVKDAAGAELALRDGTPPPEVSVSASSVTFGETVTVTLTNGYGGSQDWLAVAAKSSPNNAYLQWTWVGAGVTTRTWAVTMPSAPGEYEFRLFLNNGFTRAATSPTVVVVQPSGVSPAIAVSATTVEGGTSITATLTDGYGGSGDWLAFAATGAANNSHLQYTYVGAGITTKTWTVTAPFSPGTYEFRLFLNNTYTRAATSPTITVPTPSTAPSLTVSSTAVSPGQSVTVTLHDGYGGAQIGSGSQPRARQQPLCCGTHTSGMV